LDIQLEKKLMNPSTFRDWWGIRLVSDGSVMGSSSHFIGNQSCLCEGKVEEKHRNKGLGTILIGSSLLDIHDFHNKDVEVVFKTFPGLGKNPEYVRKIAKNLGFGKPQEVFSGWVYSGVMKSDIILKKVDEKIEKLAGRTVALMY
jgi:hypothetical protein